MTRNRLTRPGITLIEMMVAMALSLGIMLILTESFKMALDFVRGAHATGELISQLNGAGILLSRDLGPTSKFFSETGKERLSDQRLDDPTWLPPATPNGGFFRIYAPDPGAETFTDREGFKINLSAVNHQLHFTSYMPIGASASSFTAKTTTGTPYASEAAEIAYFLVATGKSTSVSGGLPLHSLIRRERFVAKSAMDQPSLAYQPPTPLADYADVVSAVGPNPNTLFDLTNPSPPFRMTIPNTFGPGTPRYGEDIVASNVLSFEVQADWTPRAATPAPRGFATNTDAPYDFLPGTGVFDTGNTASPVMPARIKSLQIVIRVYDPRVKQTRQNTWKFAM